MDCLFRKFLLIFCHNIVFCKLTVMQIKCTVKKFPSGFLRLFQGKVKQPAVVCFENNLSVLRKDVVIPLIKSRRSKPPLCVAFFRPRIGEIQIDPVNLSLGKTSWRFSASMRISLKLFPSNSSVFSTALTRTLENFSIPI